MLKSEYLQRVYTQVVTRDPDQREFHQAVLEVLESLDLIVDKHPEYEKAGFVLITDVVPEAILEIRYYSTYNFVGERIHAYEAPVAYLTKEAAEALKNVSDDLMAQGYRIKIYDAYRSQIAVEHFKRWAQDINSISMKKYFYPDMQKDELIAEEYIATRSSHSRGSTVDLTLLDMSTGKELDMGSPFDLFSVVSHPDYKGITEQQYENRMMLQRAMVRNGFEPIDCEWWHFTLKDEPYPDTYFEFPVSAEYLRR